MNEHNVTTFMCVSGEAFIRGPCFINPAQVDHVPTRLFYKKEVIRSSREQTVPASSIVGRCAVLSYKEYCTSRFTEVAETDVYICESKCVDGDKVIKKFNKPLKVQCTMAKWLNILAVVGKILRKLKESCTEGIFFQFFSSIMMLCHNYILLINVMHHICLLSFLLQ